MATLRLSINRSHKDKSGRCAVRIEIGAKSRIAVITLGVYVKPDNWDQDNQMVLPAEVKAKSKNKIIADRYDEVVKLFDELKAKGRLPNDAARIKKLLSPSDGDMLFLDYFNKVRATKKGNTLISFNSTYTLIKTPANGLYFEDINVKWLDKLERNYKGSINGLGVYLRNIRMVYNSAVNNNIVSADHYPFRHYKIKYTQTAHRNMSLRDFKRVIRFNHPDLNWAKDVFLLSFCLIGINMKDLFYLESIQGGRVVYNRSKTNRLYQVKVEPDAMRIIDRLKGNGTLFAFQNEYADSSNFTKGVNRRLKEIAVRLNIPHFTTYHARHSWATFASYLDISEKTIRVALGHGSRSVTDIYVNYDMRKVDAANKLVIDYVNRPIVRIMKRHKRKKADG